MFICQAIECLNILSWGLGTRKEPNDNATTFMEVNNMLFMLKYEFLLLAT